MSGFFFSSVSFHSPFLLSPSPFIPPLQFPFSFLPTFTPPFLLNSMSMVFAVVKMFPVVIQYCVPKNSFLIILSILSSGFFSIFLENLVIIIYWTTLWFDSESVLPDNLKTVWRQVEWSWRMKKGGGGNCLVFCYVWTTGVRMDEWKVPYHEVRNIPSLM